LVMFSPTTAEERLSPEKKTLATLGACPSFLLLVKTPTTAQKVRDTSCNLAKTE